jgi:hypothetical protein
MDVAKVRADLPRRAPRVLLLWHVPTATVIESIRETTMNNKSLLCITLGSIALAGCAAVGTMTAAGPPPNPACPTPAIQIPTIPCIHNACPLWVQVVPDATGKCVVLVEADKLKMAQKNRDVTIYWWSPSQVYEFRSGAGPFANPIIFKAPNEGEAPGQFYNLKVDPVGRWVTITDRNTDKKDFGYKVRVFKKGGGPNDWLESDPAIMNDP